MTSGRRWVYIWVDVGWTSGGVALPVKCSPRLDNYCQSRRSIRDRRSTIEQSVVTFRISRSRLTDAVKTSETCGFVAIASWIYATSPDVILRRSFTSPSTALGDRRPGNEARFKCVYTCGFQAGSTETGLGTGLNATCKRSL